MYVCMYVFDLDAECKMQQSDAKSNHRQLLLLLFSTC
jgi:hypothetical protein